MSEADELLRREASDPDTPVRRLRALMLRPHHRAWHNPSAPLVLFTAPGQDLVAAAILLLRPDARPHAYRHESADETLRALALQVARWQREPRCARRDTARHLAGLFGLPWAEP